MKIHTEDAVNNIFVSKGKVKLSSYRAQCPVLRNAQSVCNLRFISLVDLLIQTPKHPCSLVFSSKRLIPALMVAISFVRSFIWACKPMTELFST